MQSLHKKRIRKAFLIFFIAILAVMLQTAFFSSFTKLEINLTLALTSVALVYFPLLENLLFVSALVLSSAALFYDSNIQWPLIVMVYVLKFIQPKEISDKFLLCSMYLAVVTLLYEIFNPLDIPFATRALNGLLVNFVVMAVLYLFTGLFVRRFYPSLLRGS